MNLSYKTHNLKTKLEEEVSVQNHNVDEDGDVYLRYGWRVHLHHTATQNHLSINAPESQLHNQRVLTSPCTLTSSQSPPHSCTRNIFSINKCSGEASGEYVRYGDVITLTSLPDVGGNLNATSEERRSSFFKKSRHNDVTMTSQVEEGACGWKLIDIGGEKDGKNDRVRLDHNLYIRHCKTNGQLAVLSGNSVRTPFGFEMEVVARPLLGCDSIDMPEDCWQIRTSLPLVNDFSFATTLAV